MYYCDDTGCEIQTYQCFALLTKVYGLFRQHTKWHTQTYRCFALLTKV